MVQLKRRDTLVQQLVTALRARITDGGFKGGERLPSEQELVAEFGVSRTVVREAITNLKGIGLVTTQQGVGAFVLRTSPGLPFHIEEASLGVIQEVVAVLDVRMGLETEAAALAAVRRTPADLAALQAALDTMADAIPSHDDAVQPDLDFHAAIARATGNRHFLDLFSHLGGPLIPRSRLHTFQLIAASREAYLGVLLQEHADIFAGIAAGNCEQAREAMRIHLGRSRDRLQRASLPQATAG
ncbi:GntR family transcriptional regulator [Azorhizobium oxalatiphilum]|uniref:GntR family transcriptional regulator n=1 Tax=Azorhizobium oxalatiphilum TaxID=980631 RepID=A0A917CFT6_9HYPH|nr:FadR/GntR family transcriptional regulator [Azorhizobium oxalatiphilum]GGF86590.1 GntR family transcriptional regulator [Azorhizobium oxalatiphilum]